MANTKSLDLEASSSQYASIADASQTGLDITTDFTIEAWIKIESDPDSAATTIVSKRDGSGDGYTFTYGDQSGTNYIGVNIQGTYGSYNKTLTVGVWYHVAAVYDKSEGEVEIYINGVSDQTLSSLSTALAASTADFSVGENIGQDRYFDGLMEHIRVWNDVRTPAEIAQYMFQEPATDAAGLVAWWKFDDDYLDQTTNDNDLTASGSPVFSDDVQWTDGGDGKVEIEHCVDDDTVTLWHMNGALASAAKKDNAQGDSGYDLTEDGVSSVDGFDGETNGAYSIGWGNKVYDTSADIDFGLNPFSIQLWFKTTYGAEFGIFGMGATNSGGRIEITKDVDDYVQWYMGTSAVGNTTVSGTTDVTDGEWHLCTCTREDRVIKIYIDGVLEGTATSGADLDMNCYGGVYFSGWDGTATSSLTVDEAIIVKRTMSAEEIAKYYAGRVSAKYYSGSGDETIQVDGNGSWDTTHDTATGTGLDGSFFRTYVGNDGTNFYIYRVYIPFLTSNLPDDANIESASLSFKANATVDQINDGNDFISVVQANEVATAGTAVVADFDKIGDAIDNPTEGIDSSERKDITSISTSVFTTFEFNNDGIGFINTDSTVRSGYTELGLREGHDILDDAIPVAAATNQVRMEDYTPESTAPYLWIEYTAGTQPTATGNFFQLF